MRISSDGWIRNYNKKGALWIHDGNPRRPHALLTSGKHSSGFFNSRLVILDGALMRRAAQDLLKLFTSQGGRVSDVEVVVGPQTGATKLAELLSYEVMDLAHNDCTWLSPEKGEVEGRKVMIFNNEEVRHLPLNPALLCEDVLTTGGSIDLTADAVIKAGGSVLPFVVVLVNRSGLVEVSGKKIVAIIDCQMPIWTPDECPLCKEGSEAIRPKGEENWKRLNDLY